MQHWLVKSEPSVYSFDQLIKDRKTFWNGVRNYAARNNLREMEEGDEVFYYHSNEGLEIVGIAEVVKESYQDPTTDNTNWVVVDLKPIKRLDCPVTLQEIKATLSLAQMDLVKNSRLSVQKVTDKEWKQVLKMAAKKSGSKK